MPDEQDFKPNENEANHSAALEVDREPSTNTDRSDVSPTMSEMPQALKPQSHKKRNGVIALLSLIHI